jgi:hypothetical protein
MAASAAGSLPQPEVGAVKGKAGSSGACIPTLRDETAKDGAPGEQAGEVVSPESLFSGHLAHHALLHLHAAATAH